MAKRQRLKLTLKNVVTDREWVHQPRVIVADPEDPLHILDFLDEMARELDGRSGRGWTDQYSVKVQPLDETWRDTFTLYGRDY